MNKTDFFYLSLYYTSLSHFVQVYYRLKYKKNNNIIIIIKFIYKLLCF